MTVGLIGCAVETPETPDQPDLPPHRLEQYQQVKQKARRWLDRLEVDPVELTARGVKGKKKLGEILDAYDRFRDAAAGDPEDLAAIQRRVEQLARHTQRSEYHNLQTCPPREFIENSLSYFRVLTLMERFGLDTTGYRAQLAAVKDRMDAHLVERGPWQRAMFAEYYGRFGLDKPPILLDLAGDRGELDRRRPADQLGPPDCYALTHQVFVAFDYGRRRRQSRLDAADLVYLQEVIGPLARRAMGAGDPDLLAELLSCMTYLGWAGDPAYAESVDYLLTHQNAAGTWGDYEAYRAAMGDAVDQHLYLHTTLVAVRALIEVFHGDYN